MAIDFAEAHKRLSVSNAVLAAFSDATIERRRGGWYVRWPTRAGEVVRRWMTRGQDFFPVWSHKWPYGGTATTALSQLIRWLRGQPILPLSTWRYWAGDKVQLLPAAAVEQLAAGGYPAEVHCVLCGRPIASGFDWWHLGDVSGPCCGWTTGCRQKGERHAHLD